MNQLFVNSAAVNIGEHVSFSIMVFSGYMLGMLFRGIATLFSIVAGLICIPTNSGNAPSPAFIVCRLLDSTHSDQREMVPHCGFDLHFSDNE